MSLKLIIPRDPLIFRDGKPFTAVPGERAKSIPFPFPTTLTGAARTQEGIDENGNFNNKRLAHVLKRYIRGPFLVELNDNEDIEKWYFPAPADALLIAKKDDHKKIKTIHVLAPLEVQADSSSDLEKLKLVGTKETVKEKAMENPPRYWTWELIQQWLLNPTAIDAKLFETESIHGPKSETRTHVSIDPATQTAIDGRLFQTSGLEFIRNGESLNQSRQLALAIETNATFNSGIGFLGGEKRIVHWENTDRNLIDLLPDLEKNGEAIKEALKNDKHCRLILVTPAYFEDGYLPRALEKKYNLTVEAVALPRYQTTSGWDYEKSAPKATRRFAPAGSVYFIKFNNEKVIEKFVDEFWLKSIFGIGSFEGRDGLGLALLGTWNGEAHKLEVKDE